MRVLYLLPTLPHPAMRGELRHYHLLRQLAARHAITLLALSKTPVASDAHDEISRLVERLAIFDASEPAGMLRAVRSPRVAKILAHWRSRRARAAMKAAVHEAIASSRFDVVLVYEAELAWLLDGFDRLPVAVDLCDAMSLRCRTQLRHVRALEYPWRAFRLRQVRRVEQRLVRSRPHLSVISNRDREALGPAGDHAVVIPNGVDLDYWRRRTSDTAVPRLVLTGVMDYPPNHDAAQYLITGILPLVRRTVPELTVTIAGRNPTPALLRMAARVGGVEITGQVPDLRPVLERAAVFVAPLRFASGAQNKILEAMAMELPVVTTSLAADGLRHGADEPPLMVANTAAGMAAHIDALLRDPLARRRIGAPGRAYLAGRFNWPASALTLERLCARAVVADAKAIQAPIGQKEEWDAPDSVAG